MGLHYFECNSLVSSWPGMSAEQRLPVTDFVKFYKLLCEHPFYAECSTIVSGCVGFIFKEVVDLPEFGSLALGCDALGAQSDATDLAGKMNTLVTLSEMQATLADASKWVNSTQTHDWFMRAS